MTSCLIGPQPPQEAGALVWWSLGHFSAELTWVCRSSSSQDLTLEAAFMVFPMTLAMNGSPALSPAAAVL